MTATRTSTQRSTGSAAKADDRKGLVAYLFTRLKRNWGKAFSSGWEKAGDRDQQRKAHGWLQAEYAEVIEGADRTLVDEVISRARREHPDWPPRPPQLQVLVDEVRQERRLGAEPEPVAVEAPPVEPHEVEAAKEWWAEYRRRRGCLRAVPELDTSTRKAETRDYYAMRLLLGLGNRPIADRLRLAGRLEV